MLEKEIEIKLQNLPEDLKKEVLDYIEFLSKKYEKKESSSRKFKFNWEGALADIDEKLTSVELQHKALEWR